MARKFVLIPAEMYQSFLGSAAQETLVHAREEFDSTLHDPTTSVAEKNILYNKRLIDLMRLRKEAEEKPFKVEVTNQTRDAAESLPNAAESTPPNVTYPATPKRPKAARKRAKNRTPVVPDEVQQLMRIVDADRKYFGVDERGRILNSQGRAIPLSDHARSIAHLLYPEESGLDPPGTKEIKTKIATSSRTRRFLFPEDDENVQEGSGLPKRFKPTLWKS